MKRPLPFFIIAYRPSVYTKQNTCVEASKLGLCSHIVDEFTASEFYEENLNCRQSFAVMAERGSLTAKSANRPPTEKYSMSEARQAASHSSPFRYTQRNVPFSSSPLHHTLNILIWWKQDYNKQEVWQRYYTHHCCQFLFALMLQDKRKALYATFYDSFSSL